jgi:hypothetical protein
MYVCMYVCMHMVLAHFKAISPAPANFSRPRSLPPSFSLNLRLQLRNMPCRLGTFECHFFAFSMASVKHILQLPHLVAQVLLHCVCVCVCVCVRMCVRVYVFVPSRSLSLSLARSLSLSLARSRSLSFFLSRSLSLWTVCIHPPCMWRKKHALGTQQDAQPFHGTAAAHARAQTR